MYPFWDLVIQPALEAVEATRVLEIGALRGETTARMLERLGPESELHVIDPVPVFDPVEHERAFPGRYFFHRALSLDALPTLPPVDAALIDGDHNWYTVYNELRLIRETSRRAGRPLPLLVLHDVGWPYGRRDLYYAPGQIPEEHRQPYRTAGMVMGRSELVDEGGMNPTMCNAEHEGGPRNGVMTAVDDFVAEHDRPLRVVVLPVYFGLALVMEVELLDRYPVLASLLDELEGRDGQAALAVLAETNRLQGTMVQHGVFFSAERRLADLAGRYLATVKSVLLNDVYLEHELRLDHLFQIAVEGAPLLPENFRDPARQMKAAAADLRAARASGRSGGAGTAGFYPLTDMGRVRLDHLEGCLDLIRREAVAGDLLECGTGRGGGAILMRAYLAAHDMPGEVYVVDRFDASAPSPVLDPEPDELADAMRALRGDLNNVRDAFSRLDLLDDRVHLVSGAPEVTLPSVPSPKVALLRIGDGSTADLAATLDQLYDRISTGGVVVVDGCDDTTRLEALQAYRAARGITDALEQVAWGTVAWRKLAAAAEQVDRVRTPAEGAAGAPLAPPPPPPDCDLSVVVVFYDMRREAQRTLHSLSRAYQQGIDDLDYEVVVVDNGSSPEERLSEDWVRSFGPEFRLLDRGDEADPTPVSALNAGIRLGRGRFFALMIDGAHVLTPGTLRYGVLGLRTYRPAIVATQQWYVGPGQQGESMTEGYDRAYEDRLFEQIGWPVDGYRLFDIGNFVGERDWLDGLWESNCLFVTRRQLRQVGCFDEGFSMPGGGYANLELYERLGSSPDTTVVTILGEGSFHQLHGGTTTNLSDIEDRHDRLASYAAHYAELKGRPFRGHGKTIHYVGTMRPDAARTRARRRFAPGTFTNAAEDPDGRPRTPTPIHQELRTEFVDAYWKSLRWKETTWLGQRVRKIPPDLFVYQELLHRVRPEWIIDIGSGDGGRAWFLATVCDLLGTGQIVSIDKQQVDGRPEHPRIRFLVGPADEDEIVDEVGSMLPSEPSALLVLGGRASATRTLAQFHAHAHHVPVGSYVVVEDTIVNGHPVWANFGRGPAEAAKAIVESRADFVADLAMEKYVLTFNPNGFLRRLTYTAEGS
jgi:cephalosporin hydroxylase/predicted O-methyltransferase YrrM